jgi:hypothetical protein
MVVEINFSRSPLGSRIKNVELNTQILIQL